MQLLLTRPRLIQELNDDLERIILFAKKSCVNFDEHTALDGECLELLRDLFANISKHVVRNIPCNRPKNPCSGPAIIILRVSALYSFFHLIILERKLSKKPASQCTHQNFVHFWPLSVFEVVRFWGCPWFGEVYFSRCALLVEICSHVPNLISKRRQIRS